MRLGWLWLLAAFLTACSGGGSGNDTDLLDVPFQDSEVLVMVEDPEDDEEIEELRRDFQGLQMERIGQTSFYILTVPQGTQMKKLLKELEDDFRVINAEPNYLGSSPEGGPSDIPILGGDLLTDLPNQQALAPLDLPGAHAFSTGAGVVVAVIDTGVDFTHPFLHGHLEPTGRDFIGKDADPTDERNGRDDDQDGLVDEQFGHGTFVSSLVLLVAPDARILPVRVLDADGYGNAATVAAGIVWAVDMGARVINLSVDLPNAPEAVKDAISYAEDLDVVVVGSAGNESLPDIDFPARFSDVIGVAAVDVNGILAPFSNYGSAVSLAAPGVTVIGALPFELSPDGTGRWSGTSFASPLVAGSAALVRSAHPGSSRTDVTLRLRMTAMPLDPLNPAFAGLLGDGMVQPALAVQ